MRPSRKILSSTKDMKRPCTELCLTDLVRVERECSIGILVSFGKADGCLLTPVLSVICVAGSGRGGIVNRCVNAISRAEVDAHVYALEKNPNACIT